MQFHRVLEEGEGSDGFHEQEVELTAPQSVGIYTVPARHFGFPILSSTAVPPRGGDGPRVFTRGPLSFVWAILRHIHP